MVRERGRLVHAMDARLATLDALFDADDLDRGGADHRRGGRRQNLCRAQRCDAAQYRDIQFFDLCAISLPLQAKLPVG